MKSRDILIYFAAIYSGDWDQIFNAIQTHQSVDEEIAMKTVAAIEKTSGIITLLDEEYPASLKAVRKPPFVLFYHGNIKLLSDDVKKFAFVGNRHLSSEDENRVKNAMSMTDKDHVLVTTMARGTAAVACRMHDVSKMICVLGTGINTCYPPSNMDIYQDACKNGLVISEYPDMTDPTPNKFLERNRIVAAISNKVIIGAMDKSGSGTAIIAAIALEQGRDVYAVPSPVPEDYVNELINEGATPFVNKNSIDWDE